MFKQFCKKIFSVLENIILWPFMYTYLMIVLIRYYKDTKRMITPKQMEYLVDYIIENGLFRPKSITILLENEEG